MCIEIIIRSKSYHLLRWMTLGKAFAYFLLPSWNCWKKINTKIIILIRINRYIEHLHTKIIYTRRTLHNTRNTIFQKALLTRSYIELRFVDTFTVFVKKFTYILLYAIHARRPTRRLIYQIRRVHCSYVGAMNSAYSSRKTLVMSFN